MRVYVKEVEGKAVVYNAVSNEPIKEFDDIAEAVKYAVDNNYELPIRSFDGEFVTDKEGNFLYMDDKKLIEYADGTLVEGAKICPKCGWVAFGEEIIDEDKEPRECFVCPHCGNIFDCTPDIEEIGEAD